MALRATYASPVRVLALALCLMLACSCGAAPSEDASSDAPHSGTPPPAETSAFISTDAPLLQCLYYDRSGFLAGAAAPKAYPSEQGTLTTGLIPHHLLAADMISGFFALVSQQKDNYDRVVLLSPSHFPKQTAGPVVTAHAGWDTPFGTVEGDADATGALLQNTALAARQDAEALERDHGVGGLVPYISYYLPGVKLTACLLANGTDPSRLDALGETLRELCADGRTLLIATVDCSHYLQPGEAALRDAETAEAIEGYNYAAIARFTDDNVDSPECLTAFLRATEAQGAALARLGHATAADKLPPGSAFPEGITTYFVYAGFT